MTMMSCESNVCDHKWAALKLRENIFLSDTDCDPSWLGDIGYCAREESSVFHCIEYAKNLISEGLAMLAQKKRKPCYAVDSRVRRGAKCEIVRGFCYVWDEIIKPVIMKFESIFSRKNRRSEIALRGNLDKIIDIHANTTSCWQSSSRIVWLIDESHLFQLFHIIADGSRGDLHRLIADERFAASSIATLYILSDDDSEDLDFSGIYAGFTRHCLIEKR